MGNQQIGYGNPNVVEVYINPGGGCCFQIDPHVQDARLAHFVTADDYAQKIEKANHVFRQQGACRLGPCVGFWACMIGVVIIISVMMALFFREPGIECLEPNGVCKYGTDAVEGQCCNFWCCSSEFDGFVANATARFDGGEGGGLSARLDRKCHWYDTPDECGGYRTCGIEYYCSEVRRLDEVEEGESGDEGRGRRALKGKAKTKCFELEPNGYKCQPVDEGEYKEIAGVTWPASLFALMFPPAFAYLLYLCTFGCRVTSPLIAVFDEWKALGITTSFLPGTKHRRPALSFVVPALPWQLAAPQALGQPPPGSVVIAPPPGATPQVQMVQMAQPSAATQFQVLVPPGAGPGTLLQVPAPNGTQVQVVVPPGASPGTAFMVAA
jgi:hypothetical protein